MPEAGISEQRARQHEALVLRLEALLDDVRRLAARWPEGTVSDALRSAAEGLLYEAQRFGVRGGLHSAAGRAAQERPAGKRVDAPPTLGALMVELGQARARLEAFELGHSFWSGKHKAFVWRVARGPLPIGRLRPVLQAAADPRDDRTLRDMRRKVLQRFAAREEEAYQRGYRDAQTGTPPKPESPLLAGVLGDS